MLNPIIAIHIIYQVKNVRISAGIGKAIFNLRTDTIWKMLKPSHLKKRTPMKQKKKKFIWGEVIKKIQQNQITAMVKKTIWKNFKVLVTLCEAKILWIIIITAMISIGCRATKTIEIKKEVRIEINKK